MDNSLAAPSADKLAAVSDHGPFPPDNFFRTIDRASAAFTARLTGGLSPAALWLAYVDAAQMAGAFQLLKSNDLIWSRMVHDYLMGVRTPMINLIAWKADTTRMPYRMHSEYLRKLYLGNDLASGRYVVDGHLIALQNIRAPIFAVGTEHDHVAPWQSVYKIHYLSAAAVTFALTSGGHNAGIVSEPGHPHRHFRIAAKAPADALLSAEEWIAAASIENGSWWPAWADWLTANSTGEPGPPPSKGWPTSRKCFKASTQ